MKHPLWTTAVVAAAAALSLVPAHAAGHTETFDGTTATNAGYGSGAVIPGTALEVLSAPVHIGNDASSDHGNHLDLTSGW